MRPFLVVSSDESGSAGSFPDYSCPLRWMKDRLRTLHMEVEVVVRSKKRWVGRQVGRMACGFLHRSNMLLEG